MANRNTGVYGHFGDFSSAAQLPNTAGADVQTNELTPGSVASVNGSLYVCSSAALGAAAWALAGLTREIGSWAPSFVDTNGVVDALSGAPAFYTRSVGDIDLCDTSLVIPFEAVANGTPNIEVTNFPHPILGSQANGLPVGLLFSGPSAPANLLLAPNLDTPNTLTVIFLTPLVIGDSGVVLVYLRYEVDPA